MTRSSSRSRDPRPAGPATGRARLQDDVVAVLEARARAYASRQLEVAERPVVADVIVARLGRQLLATPTLHTVEARDVEVAAIPGSTLVLPGVFQVRGRCLSLADLAPFFGDSHAVEHGDRTLVLIVRGAAGELGLRVDEIVGSRRVHQDELDHGLAERALEFVAAVTTDLVHLLDVERLMAMPQIRGSATAH